MFKSLFTQVTEIGGSDYASYTKKFERKYTESKSKSINIPIILQERVSKLYELRVVYINGKTFTAKIDSTIFKGTQIDWRRNPEDILSTLEIYDFPEEVAFKLKNFMDKMGLKYGSVDLIVTLDKRYIFLEVNSCGSWNWVQRATGLPILENIVDYLEYNQSI